MLGFGLLDPDRPPAPGGQGLLGEGLIGDAPAQFFVAMAEEEPAPVARESLARRAWNGVRSLWAA